MGQSLEGKIKVAVTQPTVRKRSKPASQRKGKLPLKTSMKKVSKSPSFFQSFADQFNQVAPLDWVPTLYQIQIKAAKPVKLAAFRKKKTSTSFH